MVLSYFYTENEAGEQALKPRPETKTITALERVIELDKDQATVDAFADMVADGYQWEWFDLYQQYLIDLAHWQSLKDAFIPVDGSVFNITEPVEPVRPEILTGAQVYEPYKRDKLKRERAKAVNSITVEVNDRVFDGDELSQLRMLRAIMLLDDSQTMPWTLADNTIVDTNKAELTQAISLAGAEQSALWQI